MCTFRYCLKSSRNTDPPQEGLGTVIISFGTLYVIARICVVCEVRCEVDGNFDDSNLTLEVNRCNAISRHLRGTDFYGF